MAIGMTYDEFWNGDNEMPRMYRKAHELKLKEANQMAWIQGAYVYQAVGALAPALKAFSRGKPADYLDKPIGWEDEEPRERRPKERKVTPAESERARTWMEMWAMNFNDKFEKQEEEKGGEVNA